MACFLYNLYYKSLNMNSNAKPKGLLLLGIALTLTGYAFKLNQLMGAPTLFNIGVALSVIGLTWWAVNLFRS